MSAFRLFVALLLLAASGAPAFAQPELISAIKLDEVSNAVTVTSDGIVFVGFPRVTGVPGLKVAKLVDGKPVAFPDEAWNAWRRGGDPSHAFVRFNSMRIGPDGNIWIVDVGSPAISEPIIEGGPKILAFDPKNGKLVRSYGFSDRLLFPRSFIDDIRFNDDVAYITDAGIPGLIVLDLKTGDMRRVLDRQPSTTDQQPMRARGHALYDQDGKDVKVHSDQLEVAPNGKNLYYMPSSGPLYRVATSDLADKTLSDVDLEKRVKTFAKVGTTGGTAIDAAGNIYVSDTDQSSILKVTPSGSISTLLQDERLDWPDAMWIDQQGFLWVPASQMDRTPPFNAGRAVVAPPVNIFKLQIGAKPSPIDHP